jgi:hypothetical protein
MTVFLCSLRNSAPVVWSVRAGGMDRPLRTKSQPSGSRAVVLGQYSIAFGLIGRDSPGVE